MNSFLHAAQWVFTLTYIKWSNEISRVALVTELGRNGKLQTKLSKIL